MVLRILKSIGRRSIHFRHDKFSQFYKYVDKLETSDSSSSQSLFFAARDSISLLKSGLEDLKELQNMANDTDMKELANDDIKVLEPKLNDIIAEISRLIVKTHQRYDENDAILEVVPGAGGLEASLFAEEVFNLYKSYAQNHLGLDVETIQYEKQVGVIGGSGLTKGSISIKGLNVFQRLKYECGVHRVQRVPITGTKNDRLQTSTCSVAVLPLPSAQTMKSIPEKDLSCEYNRASGPGGQGVNKSMSAVRLTHIPTGTVVNCQVHRTPTANRKVALEKLQQQIFQAEYESELNVINSSRQSQIGRMDRNEKIRTYNYPRNQISDHRISLSKQVPNINEFMKGKSGFDVLLDFQNVLKIAEEEETLLKIISN